MSIYALAPGISFCNAGGRHVFLDLTADRYFCLSAAAEDAFARLADGVPLDALDQDQLAALAVRGVLRVVEHGDPVPLPARSAHIRRSLADATGTVRALDVAIAAAALVRARLSLRRRPLGDLIAAIERRKTNLLATGPDRSEDRLAQTAAAFRHAALLAGSLDQCLAVSLGMTHRALSQHLATELVLGVKLRPFQAHAWVQAGELVVSDRLDTVAPFTPILVI